MYKKTVLKNGLKVITSRMPHMESVSIGIWIGVGGRYEGKKVCGMSHLIEHMLFKGTASRTANELKEAIEGVGGSFNGFTSEEFTCYLVKLASRYLELGLDVLSDMVLNPVIDPAELKKEKYVICEEIKMYMDQPSHHVFDILAEAMWPGHALGRPIAGYLDSVKDFEKASLTAFKERFYQPSNISIVATGRVDERKVRKISAKFFSENSSARSFPYETVKRSDKGSDIRIFKKDTKQTHLALGFHSIKRDHRLRYAASLLNIILGGNMSSRLFDRLREKKALCYDISSSVKKYRDTGAFVIHAGVDNVRLLEASREIIHELDDMRKNPATGGELLRAKEYARGQLQLALEDTSSRMLWVGEKIMTEGKAPSINEIFRNVEKVTLEDVRKTAGLIFTKENLNFATVGPAGETARKKLKKTLAL